jgi:predicted nuclease of predicted toxin-antitoxin system
MDTFDEIKELGSLLNGIDLKELDSYKDVKALHDILTGLKAAAMNRKSLDAFDARMDAKDFRIIEEKIEGIECVVGNDNDFLEIYINELETPEKVIDTNTKNVIAKLCMELDTDVQNDFTDYDFKRIHACVMRAWNRRIVNVVNMLSIFISDFLKRGMTEVVYIMFHEKGEGFVCYTGEFGESTEISFYKCLFGGFKVKEIGDVTIVDYIKHAFKKHGLKCEFGDYFVEIRR